MSQTAALSLQRGLAQSHKLYIFNDPIHGHIELSPLSMAVIDTAQFQRLRDISQLGSVYYVFSGASSKRFEHCIGVAHLSRTFVHELAQRQPELGITPQDMLCVELAGLCHDLGHGPFSHLFDGLILPKIWAASAGQASGSGRGRSSHFEHEHASIGIFDLLIRRNGLLPEFAKYGLGEDDIHFIKELMIGSAEDLPEDSGLRWKGRGDKTFLYDIVANKRNGIDVDKFDYFARDCHVLGLTKSFDALRLMRFARVHRVHRSPTGSVTSLPSSRLSVFSDTGRLEICYHIKEAWNLFELFHTRYTLHKRAYQHRVAGAIDHMIAETFILADPFVFIPGTDNVPTRVSDCPSDYEAYWKLGEYLLRQIENSFDEKLKPSRLMIRRLRERELLPYVAEILLSPERLTKKLRSDQIHQDLFVKVSQSSSEAATVAFDDIFVTVVSIGYGKGGKNPVSELTAFYQPMKPHEASVLLSQKDPAIDAETSDEQRDVQQQYAVGLVPQDSVSLLAPSQFQESYVRVYCRYTTQVEPVRAAFYQWCEQIKVPFASTTPLKRPRSRSHDFVEASAPKQIVTAAASSGWSTLELA